jgi:hypothetical protein
MEQDIPLLHGSFSNTIRRKIMQIKPGNYCPLIKKKCIEGKCAWFTHVRGLNPNTGTEIDEWGCAIAWMPVMAIEISQKENQTGAAVESFRNEVIRVNSENQQLYMKHLEKLENNEIIQTSITPLNPVINLLEGTPEEKNDGADD